MERESALHSFEQVVGDATTGAGRMIVVEGAPGIGKSALLTAIVEIARQAGAQVVGARAGELESEFAFGVVRQLLESPLHALSPADREQVLSGSARLCAGLLGFAGSNPADGDVFPIMHGLYWTCANLAELRPLAIVVDDAQWADAPSLRWLHYLSRRLEGVPAVIVLATRTTQGGERTVLINAIKDEPNCLIIRPEPLSERGSRLLLGELFGQDPHTEFSLVSHRVSAGNPFLLVETARSLADSGVTPDAAAAHRILDGPAEAISRAALTRLTRLPAASQELAQAVTILGDGIALNLAATFTGQNSFEAGIAFDALGDAELLEPNQPPRFTHALIRAALYAEIPAGVRAREHARAARMLAKVGAGLEHSAAHLLLVDGDADPWAVEVLLTTAKQAAHNGAPEVAETYLRRALAEPPPAEAAADVLRLLGQVLTSQGDQAGVDAFAASIDLTSEPRERALLTSQFAGALTWAGRFGEALEVLDHAVLDLADTDPGLTLRLTAQMSTVGRLSPTMYSRTAKRLRALAPRLQPDDPAAVPGHASLAIELAMRGRCADEIVAMVQPVVEGISFDPIGYPHSFYDVIYLLIVTDRFAVAHRLLDEAETEVRQLGLHANLGHLQAIRADLNHRTGDLLAAETAGRDGFEISMATGSPGIAVAGAHLCQTLLDRGDAPAAREVVEEATRSAPIPDGFLANFLLYARGRLRIESGQCTEGLADMLELAERERPTRREVPAMMPWRSTAALASLHLGERVQAERLAAEEVALAERFGARRALGVALRASGLVRGGQDGLGTLFDAVSVLERSGARIEHARALTDLGAALRRANRRTDARGPLRQAVELARAGGAHGLATRAREELRATGARPRRLMFTGVDSLTASERRVAELAARGRSNREIAEHLFVTRKTIETHLGSVYRKLSIKGREMLSPLIDGTE